MSAVVPCKYTTAAHDELVEVLFYIPRTEKVDATRSTVRVNSREIVVVAPEIMLSVEEFEANIEKDHLEQFDRVEELLRNDPYGPII